uniref:Putative reverse transcriptase domain-containing protein n=1 Tax=Tanacetum cinerariifolium TaxID=118510 RepID=A0A6L2JDJ9_TANCI|nr:putative reverse transcriptase domain-containing protein [Tanacetum cinerariifolium]
MVNAMFLSSGLSHGMWGKSIISTTYLLDKIHLLMEIGKSSRVDDEVVQDQRQQDDNDFQDERQDQPKEEDVEPRRSKRARTEKSFGPDFVSFMVKNEPTSYREAKKMKANGTIDKYKARLAIKGFRQQAGLYYFDTYSTRITPVKMILAIAALRNGEVHQMDVKMTFLNGDLEKILYMNQPEGFMAPILESKETTDKIVQIKKRITTARDRQKSYVDNRRKPLEFGVGDKVLLKVSPWKGVVRFGKRSKLSPRYVGSFEVVERVGHVLYRLRLPQEPVGIHDTFHVSNLKKCLADVTLHVPLGEIKIDDKLRFVEEPIKTMDCEVKKLKRIWIPIVKVHWNSRRGPKFTWEQKM